MKSRYAKRMILLVALVAILFILVFALSKVQKSVHRAKTDDTKQSLATSNNIDDSDFKLSDKKLLKKYPESAHLLIGLKGSKVTLVKEGEDYVEPGAYALDDRTGAVTNIKIKGSVDTSKPGEYRIEYIAKSDRAASKAIRTVKVVKADKFDANDRGIPVLMYHYVFSGNDAPSKLDSNFILDSELEKQLKWLKDNNYYYPSFAELSAYIDGKHSLPKKSVILTFDDGQVGFLNYGIPLLNKYKIPATGFLIGTRYGPDIVKADRSKYVCYQSHSYDMHRAGGNIGHGGRISAMSLGEIEEDLNMAIAVVGNKDAFAYPYGDVTEDGKKAVENCGISCAFTTQYGKVEKGDDKTALPRIRVLGQAGLEGFISSIK